MRPGVDTQPILVCDTWAGKPIGCPRPVRALRFRATPEAFEADPWAAEHAAEDHLRALGYTVGPMQRDAPRAAFLRADYVAKWRNLDAATRRRAHALLFSRGRGHSALVEIYVERVDAAAERAAGATP